MIRPCSKPPCVGNTRCVASATVNWPNSYSDLALGMQTNDEEGAGESVAASRCYARMD